MGWKSRLIELKSEGATYSDIADTLNVEYPQESFTGSRVRGWWRRNGEKRAERTQTYRNGVYQITDNINIPDNATPEAILKAYGLKLGRWEVLSYKRNTWQAQGKDGDIVDLYQSTVSVKAVGGVDYTDIAEYVNTIVPAPYTPAQHHKGDCMAEVNIADLHLGKLSWRGDTGNNYDYKIARANFEKIIADVCYRLKDRPLDYILFVWSNDYFNSDTIAKTTTGMTPQDTDIRWQKLFRVGFQMLIEAVESLRQIAPVKTFYTPSNHDQMAGYYATCVLEQKFLNYPDVEVDTDAFPRKYIEYGTNLIGFTHGDKEQSRGTKEKASRLASTMPNEAREAWGRTTRHEIHAAHLHCEQMIDEINGVLVRRVSSPTNADTWHTEHAFIGAQQKAMTFVWHKDYGNIEIHNSFV